MVGIDIPRIVREWASQGYDPVLERLGLLYEIVLDAPRDLVDFAKWALGLGRILASDWYAFSSIVFFSTLPFGIYALLGIVHDDVLGLTALHFLGVLEQPLTLLTGIILLGVGAVYAVRT